MADPIYTYLNYAQRILSIISPRTLRAVFPRRSGKTHGVLAPYMHKVQKSMPRGSGIFAGATRKQILGRTLPAVLASWRSMWGLVEGANFVIGRPPQKLNFPDPIYKPIHWESTMSFANGFIWNMISLAVPMSANGLTASSICMDEARSMVKSKIDSELIPALSGVVDPYRDPAHSSANPFYKSTCFVSDASLSAKGNWLEREDRFLKETIDLGPNKGRTHDELKQELIDYAKHVIRVNDAAYYAKKTGHKVMVESEETIRYAKELRGMVQRREGKFRVLPNGDNSESNCQTLVRLGVLTERDAELLFNADYILTKDDYIFMKVAMNSPKFQEHIRQLRRDVIFFQQGSTIDNIALLGEDYIRTMKASLSPLVFQISILGLKVKLSGEGFYYALDVENIHGYIDADDNGVIDDSLRVKRVSREYNGATYTAEVESPDFDRLADINDCRMDGDLHGEDNLYIAMDYNARINWVAIGVVRRDPDNCNAETLYCIKSMFVKTPDRIEALMKNFNNYYAPHRRRNPNITYFYDSTAKQGANYALEHKEDFKDVVIRLLQAAGWYVTAIDMGRPMAHDTKYTDINNGLAGISYPAFRINTEQNEDLIIALEHAEVEQGYNGFRKSKAGEKLAFNPDGEGEEFSSGKLSNIMEEHRTDGTDALDSLYLGVKYFRYGGGEVFACM